MIDKFLKSNKFLKTIMLFLLFIVISFIFIKLNFTKTTIYEMNVKNYFYRSSITVTEELDSGEGILTETTVEIFEDEVVQDGKTEKKDYKVSYYKEEDYKKLGRKISKVEWAQDWGDYYPGQTSGNTGSGGAGSKGGLTWPTDATYITSLFGYQQERVDAGLSCPHWGVDVAGPAGTALKAAHPGTVTQAGGGGYNTIVIQGEKFTTKYLHCGSVSVSEGQQVQAGEVIGGIGDTGSGGAYHLHFQVDDNASGETIDPLLFFILTPNDYDYTSDRMSSSTARAQTPEGYYSYAGENTAGLGGDAKEETGNSAEASNESVQKAKELVEKANDIVGDNINSIMEEVQGHYENYNSKSAIEKSLGWSFAAFLYNAEAAIKDGINDTINDLKNVNSQSTAFWNKIEEFKKSTFEILLKIGGTIVKDGSPKEKLDKIVKGVGDDIKKIINDLLSKTNIDGTDSTDSGNMANGATSNVPTDQNSSFAATAKAQSQYKKNEIYPAKDFNAKKDAYGKYYAKGYSYDDLYFAFQQIESYYKELEKAASAGSGNNLGGLIWPVQLEEGNEGGNKITSLWGLQKDREGGATVQPNHPAIDIAGGGTPNILAATSGTVVEESSNLGCITIRSDDGRYLTQYMHMDPVSVSVGDKVTQGQVVGVMGGAGGYPVHLHFAVAMDINGDGTIDSDMDTETIDPVEFYNVEAVGGQTPDPYPYGDNNRTADWRYGYTGGGEYYKFVSVKATGAGGTNMEIIWKYLTTTMGCTEEAAAGVMGNMRRESGSFDFPTTADQEGEGGRDGSGGYGICQWDDRRELLWDTATNNGYDVNDINYQLEFLKMEVFPGGTQAHYFTGGWETFSKMTNIYDATVEFEASFERSSVKVLDERAGYAREVYQMMTGKTPTT